MLIFKEGCFKAFESGSNDLRDLGYFNKMIQSCDRESFNNNNTENLLT